MQRSAMYIFLATLGFLAWPAGLNSQSAAPTVAITVTEEGQHVVFDRYTWQRRELAKRLPLDQPWPDESHIAESFGKYQLDQSSVPEFIPVPAKILPGIFLVGSNPTLTYLIDCGPEGVAIVDPGIAENYDLIIANVEKLGYPKTKIHWVINTHAHFDHSGSDYLFHKLGAQILIGEADAAAVEKGTLVTATTGRYIHLDKVPSFTISPVDHRVSDGEELLLGNQLFIAIHTPGHTDGSTCFDIKIDGKNVLFGGDTVLYDNRLGYQALPWSDNRAYVDSLEKLAKFYLLKAGTFRWDILLPGHGTIVLDRAYMDVLKGWRTADQEFSHGIPIPALPFATQDYRTMMYGRP